MLILNKMWTDDSNAVNTNFKVPIGFWNLCDMNKVACAFPIAAKQYGYDTSNDSDVAIVWRNCFCPVLFILSPGFYHQCSLRYDCGGKWSLLAEFPLMVVVWAHWIVRFLRHESRFALKTIGPNRAGLLTSARMSRSRMSQTPSSLAIISTVSTRFNRQHRVCPRQWV